MFLSELSFKRIYFQNAARGIILGVGISVKTRKLKYLLCSANTSKEHASHTPDFVLPISAIASVSENAVILTKLRPVIPKGYTRLFLHRPIYTQSGTNLGLLTDVRFDTLTATSIYSDKNIVYPFTSISAVSDAVLLRKNDAYPIGQRIPAPLVSHFEAEKNPHVTKSVLRRAIENKALIKLTLSLPPFTQNTSPPASKQPKTHR